MDQLIASEDFTAAVRTRWGLVNFDRRDRYIGSALTLYSEYAAIEIQFLLQYIKPDMLVLDIGANVGTHSVAFEWAGAQVMAFEPQRSIYRLLRSNLRHGRAYNMALGADNTTRFLTPAENNGNSGGVSIADEGSEEVTVRTLDSFGLEDVGFIKIDVEGSEHDVLVGGEKTITRCRPILYLENDRTENSATLLRWLMRHSYEVYWHTPSMFDPNNPCERTDNIFPGLNAINILAVPCESTVERPELHRVLHPKDQPAASTSVRDEATLLVSIACDLINRKHCITAVAALRRAIALAPDKGDAWAELGVALHALGRFPEAIKALERAILLDPTYLNAKSNLALVKGILEDYDHAESLMKELIEIPIRAIPERIHLGLMLLSKGDWERGLTLYEQRIGVVVKEFKLPKLGVPYWQGENLDGKTLYVQTEQGIGDTIAFSRYLTWVKERHPTVRIKFNCHTSYENLLWEFRHLVEFVPSGVLWPDPGSTERFDYGVYLHSLAYLAGARLDNIRPDPGLIRRRVDMQCEQVGFNMPAPTRAGVRKVGICWTGNPENPTQARRSVPLDALLWLATDPNCVLYSLQCGPGQADIARLGAHVIIEDLSEAIQPDLVHTGVAIRKLDVVVTCCTSIAHLAGALGVPTFLMLCHDPYWVWGREPHTTPWYPSVRVFRQETRGDWNSVIRNVASALRTL